METQMLGNVHYTFLILMGCAQHTTTVWILMLNKMEKAYMIIKKTENLHIGNFFIFTILLDFEMTIFK